MPKKKVEIIEPVKLIEEGQKKLRVCAYARVSTGNDEQKSSIENQIKYYTDRFESNSECHFIGVFADRAISGTTDKRPQFLTMIKLAEQGNIDVIYTKSISRFSRNTTDLSNYCKTLREHGVDVVFEEEGLRLLDATGTLLLTVLGAISQMEVENTRERVNWLLQNRMRQGLFVGQAAPLGYDAVDDQLFINEEEAETVRYIFSSYLSGIGCLRIAKELEKMGAKTKRGNQTWNTSTVMGILKNEKYTGTFIQGKTYTSKFDHKRYINNRNANKYISSNHHEAIISVEDFEEVQKIIESRSKTYSDGGKRGKTTDMQFYPFTHKLTCAYCGKYYVRHKVHAGSKYEKIVWTCSTKIKKGVKNCPKSKAVEEDYLKKAVVIVIKDLIEDSDSIFRLSKSEIDALLKDSEKSNDGILEQITKYDRKIKTIKKKKEKLFDLFLSDDIPEEKYNETSSELDSEVLSLTKAIDDLRSAISFENIKRNTVSEICRLIQEEDIDGFNERLFNYIIKRIVVGGKRLDGVDDPKSLHHEFNMLNFNTGLKTEVDDDGVLHYSMDLKRIFGDEEYTDDLYSFYGYTPR